MDQMITYEDCGKQLYSDEAVQESDGIVCKECYQNHIDNSDQTDYEWERDTIYQQLNMPS